MTRQPKERTFTDQELTDFRKAKADYDAGGYDGLFLTDKPTKHVDAETFDYIKTLREIYHSSESGIYARRMALECLDRHEISASWDNDNAKQELKK